MDLSKDPVVNVIYQGIKEPIKLCMENSAQRAALQLMYAAIDSLAKLGMPEDQKKSTRSDYAQWCDNYLNFDSREKVKGIEWFAARSGLLHNYTAESELSSDGKARMIGYYSGEGPDIIYNQGESERLIMVRIEGLINVFYKGLDAFVVNLYKNISHEVVEERFNKMFHLLAYDNEKPSSN